MAEQSSDPKYIRYLNGSIGQYIVNLQDDVLNIDTSSGAITIILPNIVKNGLNLYPKRFYVNDIGNNAGTNNIIIQCDPKNSINIGHSTTYVLKINGVSAEILIVSQTEWLVNADQAIAGTGTVSSVAANNFSPLFTTSVANASTTPTLSFAAINQNANLVYASPSSGSAGSPTFRSLVAADFPANIYWGITGNAGTIDGTNFLGTTDSQPLNFRIYNTAAGRIDHAFGNVFLGYQSGYSTITGGYSNTAVGEGSIRSNTIGTQNSAFGFLALNANIAGNYNTAIGYATLNLNTVGSLNTVVGYNAGTSTTGSNNTILGASCGTTNSTGSQNVFIGYNTANSNATGNYNTIVGYLADLGAGNISFSTAIGYGANVNQSNSIVLGAVGSGVNVGIGTSAPLTTLQVIGNNNTLNGTSVVNAVAATLVSTYASWTELKASSTLLNNFLVSSVNLITVPSISTSSASIFVGSSGSAYWDNAGGNNLNTGSIFPSLVGANDTIIVNASANSVNWAAASEVTFYNLKSGGIITNIVGYFINGFQTGVSNPGTTTNYYGLYNRDQTGASGIPGTSNRWGIYQADPSQSYFNGKTGFGVIAPVATVDISGTFKYVDGNQASGKVLTTDASGNATWQASSSGSGTVTSVSVVTNQGVSGTVATATTTPAITLSLGALTGVTSLNGLVIIANTGVITTGTWNGTILTGSYGGTGINNGSTTLNFGTGGTLGSNAFTSTTYAPIASPTFTGTVTIPALTLTLTGNTTGDMWYDGGSGVVTRLAIGASGTILTGGTTPSWSASPTITTSLTVPLLMGGTAASSSAEIRATSGTGSSEFIKFTGGTNGGTEYARFIHGGPLCIGTTSVVNTNDQLTIVKNTTVNIGMTIRNNSNASGAGMSYILDNNVTTAELFLGGSGYTSYGVLTANRLSLYNTGSAGIGLMADGAGADIRFATGAGAPAPTRWIIDANGQLIGNNTGGNNIVGGIAASDFLTLQATTGTGSSEGIKFTGGTNGSTEWARFVHGGSFFVGSTAAGANAERMGLTFNSNGDALFGIYNSSTGSAADAGLFLQSDGTSGGLFMLQLSSGYTTNGMLMKNRGVIYNNGANGIGIGAGSASAPITFFTGGIATGNERMRILSTGEVLYGYTAVSAGAENWGFQKNQNGQTYLQIANMTAGTSSSAVVGVQSDGFGLSFGANSSSLTASGIFQPNGSYFDGNGTGGLYIGAPNGTLNFYTGGRATANVRWSIDNTGQLLGQTAGKGISIKSGSNCKIGTGALIGGTVTITNTSVTAASKIFLQDTTSGSLTNVGTLSVVAGSGSFIVTSTNILDTSTFNYIIFETN